MREGEELGVDFSKVDFNLNPSHKSSFPITSMTSFSFFPHPEFDSLGLNDGKNTIVRNVGYQSRDDTVTQLGVLQSI
jgi:hypothetical protein